MAEKKKGRPHLDLLGHRFGRLLVIEYLGHKNSTSKSKSAMWLCLCDCGNTIQTTSACLTTGMTRSCGCLKKEICSRKFIDLTGERFGKLTVIGIDHRRYTTHKKMNTYWKCKCDCGNEVVVLGASLRRGATTSCGCKRRNFKRYVETS